VRFGAIFAAACMVLIAISLGVVSYLRFDFRGLEAVLVGITILMALLAYSTLAARLRDRADATEQISGLTRNSSDMTRQLAEFGRRLNTMDGRVERAFERSTEKAQPLSSELADLSSQVKELAGSVAAHDAALSSAGARYRGESVEGTGADRPDSAVAAAALEVSGAQVKRAVDAFSRLDREAIIALVRDGIDAGRVDLYLQPIVTLPQRSVRYYEAKSRLKAESGEVIAAGDFLKYAEAGSLMPKLDQMTVVRCVQVVRRLLLKNREIGLLCNLSSATLTDSGFPQLLEFIEANRAIGPSLVFQFTQGAVRAMGPAEHESLAALAERGFRFSMDNLVDLDLEGRELHERGFLFIKAPVPLLLAQSGTASREAGPTDLSGSLSGFGLAVVAERIDSEGAVAALVEGGVRLGQGNLFAPPRPVRAEALQDGNGQGVQESVRPEPVRANPTASERSQSSADLLASAAAAANEPLGVPRNQAVRTSGRR
jgi:cyclic-di-GMP phosphodiesterase TipF (flagellum assembly factor)